MGITYASLEDVKSAMDMAVTARADAQVMRLLDAASRQVEALCHRQFYPERSTRYFEWPNDQMGRSYRLWLDANELISIDAIDSGGTPITEYFLEPANSGPPYSRLEIDLTGLTGFVVGTTWQRTIAITGTFGACAEVELLTTTTAAAGLASTLALARSASPGELLRVDGEYMRVTSTALGDVGQTLGAELDASMAQTAVPVQDGTAFALGEVVTIGTERMLIVDIAADTLIVVRAWDGSVLAAHSVGAAIYAPRLAAVSRGLLGSASASILTGADVYRHVPPSSVRELVIAETLAALQHESASYTPGTGRADRKVAGSTSALEDLREAVYTVHGRKVRKRAV